MDAPCLNPILGLAIDRLMTLGGLGAVPPQSATRPSPSLHGVRKDPFPPISHDYEVLRLSDVRLAAIRSFGDSIIVVPLLVPVISAQQTSIVNS